MSNRKFGRWGQAAVRIVLAFSVVYLAGCRLQITADPLGAVYTNLGADCSRHCVYPVNAGEDFIRTLSAEAQPGAEFVRWEDSFGAEFSFCANPTQEICPVAIVDLVPELEGVDIRLAARFQRIDGYNVTQVKLGNANGAAGVFRPLNLDYWVEERGTTNKVYRVTDRFDGGMILLDEELERSYLLSLAQGQFSEGFGDSGSRFIAAVVGVSSKPSGWIVNRLSYGNTFGVYAGVVIEQEDGTWLHQSASEKQEDEVLTLVERSQDTLRLTAGEGDVFIANLDTGLVTRQGGSDPTNTLGYVHETRIPINGWNATRVYFSDPETDEVLGYFERTGVDRWEEFNPEGRSVAALIQRERTSQKISLEDTGAGRAIQLDFTINMVSIGPVTNLQPLPQWNISDAY